ncbi:MAG: ribonuclease H-like domain-containing protein [candidate division WOR-3 bacterium]
MKRILDKIYWLFNIIFLKKYEGYLDIETTNLETEKGEITVIGFGIDKGKKFEFIQLINNEITTDKLIKIIKKIKILYTYNGTDFDLKFIKKKLNIDIEKYCIHKDLMNECHQRNLYGGLKQVEKKLGIERKLKDINGFAAVKLWERYKNLGDKKALETLLEYNREDVLNLKILKEKLEI